MDIKTTVKTGCIHHWQLFPATSGGFTGYCKVCGEERHWPDPTRLSLKETIAQRRIASKEIWEAKGKL